MRRLILAFRSFFSILFGGEPARAPEPPAPPPVEKPAGPGPLELLALLQREARLVDFLMEDLSAYSDEQIGAAARSVVEQSRQALSRHVGLEPVIDGVEGSFIRVPPEAVARAAVRFLGNVPAQGAADGGLLRHRGWRAMRVDLPATAAGQDPLLIAPAEIEVE